MIGMTAWGRWTNWVRVKIFYFGSDPDIALAMFRGSQFPGPSEDFELGRVESLARQAVLNFDRTYRILQDSRILYIL